MILIVGMCMGFNRILKFVLSLFYVLHLNTSLRLAYYKHVEKTIPMRFIAYLLFKALHVQSRDISISLRLLVTSPFKLA